MPVTFYLLRHAQGWHNAPPPDFKGDSYNDIKFRDAELTPLGIMQTVERRKEFEHKEFDAIYCSPMRRCRQTLLAVYPQAANMNVQVDDRLIEQPTGVNISDHRFERNTIVANSPPSWDLTKVAENNPFLVRSVTRDTENIRTITQEIFKKYGSQNGTVLIVAHGMWIGRWLEMYQDHCQFINNCEYVKYTLN